MHRMTIQSMGVPKFFQHDLGIFNPLILPTLAIAGGEIVIFLLECDRLHFLFGH